MERRRILIIDAHPDPDPARFVHALAAAYERGAHQHETRHLRLADIDIPVLRSSHDWTDGAPSADIAAAQADIAWAEHIVLLYPLWLGDVPALLKAFLEQVMRPGFAFRYREGGLPEKLLEGRSARVVITMGMPAFFYRFYYGAHSARSLERNILKFVGIHLVQRTLIGAVEASEGRRFYWLRKMEELGSAGA